MGTGEKMEWPDVPCCSAGDLAECACGKEERVLRHILNWGGVILSPQQREWCLSEIDRVEGYDRADYEAAGECQLARGVISAWTDYCRDKGLL